MTKDAAIRRELAGHLFANNRMVVEATDDMVKQFPLGAPAGDAAAWLKAAAKLLGDAVELRQPPRPSLPLTLVVKDRAVLFNYTQERTLEDMAEGRKTNG